MKHTVILSTVTDVIVGNIWDNMSTKLIKICNRGWHFDAEMLRIISLKGRGTPLNKASFLHNRAVIR